jgi:hypothetical protein
MTHHGIARSLMDDGIKSPRGKDRRSFNCTCFIERLSNLEENDISFSEKLWISLVDYVTAPGNGEKALTFHLRSGEELTLYCGAPTYKL